MLTVRDLAQGSWVAVNVWNGSKESRVRISIDDGAPMEAVRTQPGEGEGSFKGPRYADPLALAKQSTNARLAVRSAEGGDRTAGFAIWRGNVWQGAPGPFPIWMLAFRSNHLWRADLPPDLPVGLHTMEVVTTDRYGRRFRLVQPFEVVETLPEMGWPWAPGGFEPRR